MSFLNPAWLWGLTALAIPIGIHLLSRKEGKTIYVGSIRHLIDSDTAQFSSIRLNEILLLIIRCLLIVLLVSLLAGLTFSTGESARKKLIVVEKGIENDAKFSSLINDLQNKGYEFRWLSDGLPGKGDSVKVDSVANYRSVVNEISSTTSDSVVVLSYNLTSRFAGARSSLPSNINWLSAESYQTSWLVDAVVKNPDSVMARYAEIENGNIIQKYRTIAKSSLEDSKRFRPADTLHIAIVFNKNFSYDVKVLRAALESLDDLSADKITYEIYSHEEPLDKKTELVFSLTAEEKGYDVDAISYVPCRSTNKIILENELSKIKCSINPKSEFILTQRLHEKLIYENLFLIQLHEVIKTYLPPLEMVEGTTPTDIAFSSDSYKPNQQPMQVEQTAQTGSIIAIILLLGLIAERIIARNRKQ